MKVDYLVIGAGAAGLSFTALMEKKLKGTGKSIALLEAHSLTGGCASYFERQGHLYDAGATTLSGLKDNGPIQKLIDELDLKLKLIKTDPGIISIFPEKTIRHFADHEKWINELNQHFPAIDNEKIWKSIYRVSEQGWALSKMFSEFPLSHWSDLKDLVKTDTLKAIKFLPALFNSVEDYLHLKEIKSEEYRAMIDELLFITAQNLANETPMLMGAMGLTYPGDTYYVEGGMKSFVTALEKKCTHIFLKHKVLSVTKQSDGFLVKTNRETFTCGTLVSSLPEWNHNELFDENFFEEKSSKKCWSAFMLYMTIPTSYERASIYYQVHCDPIPHCGSRSFFVSLSHPEDETRSKEKQSVTISCHTRSSEWENLSEEQYRHNKKVVEEFILIIFCERFNLRREDISNVFTGTSRTFKKYTHRYRGLVGGIPHSVKRNPLQYLKAHLPYENFYLIGDTQFPGQGIGAVVLGAQNLVTKLTK